MINSRVEVLHVIGAFCSGGAEWFVVNLIRTMKEKGISVGVLALSSRRDDAGQLMCQLLENEGVIYEFGPTEKVRFRSIYWYIKQISEIKPIVLHLHTPNTELIHYLASKITSSSSVIFRTLHNTFFTRNKLYLNAIWKNKALVSIACSDAVKKAREKMIQGEIIAIQNGVNFDWPIQTVVIREQKKKYLMLPPKKNHFICVGRLDGNSLELAQKAHNILINAWKLAGMGSKNCQLHVLGDGNLRSDLAKLASDDESIIFHGVRKDVHDWLLAADCYVMPSRFEGLPIAGIEAVGTGLPCLFSDIPPLREIGAPEVLWSKVDDEEQLAVNLDQIRSNRLGLSADVEKIRQKFSIERTAEMYIKQYQNVF